LMGDYLKQFGSIQKANASNDYHFEEVENISNHTHLSKLAIFTRLLFEKKLSEQDYSHIKADFDAKYQVKLKEEMKLRELEKMHGIKQKGAAPQPIKSPLLISTIQTAFYEGILNEYE